MMVTLAAGRKFDEPLVSNGYTLDTGPARLGWLEAVPENERADRAALWRRLERNGYLYFKRFFEPDKIRRFRAFYFEQLAPAGLLKPGSQPEDGLAGDRPANKSLLREILFHRIVQSAEYEAFCASPELTGFYRWLLGGEIFLHKRRIVRHVQAGSGQATGAHYDLVYLREGTGRVYTSWIPLGDCPVEDGGLIYLEGSHRTFQQLEAAAQKIGAQWLTRDLPALAGRLNSRWLVADYEAGDMVIHNAYLVHASLNNTNRQGRLRLSTDIRYQPAAEPVDRRWQNYWHEDDGL